MKTLIVVSHPEIQESSSQQYLKSALPDSSKITYHHLERTYPDGQIDFQQEQQLLLAHDRIIFQFPFYWYSSPAFLKQWQDEVLTEHFAYGTHGNRLAGKELGLVLVIGLPEKDYQAGGREGYSISTLTAPYQAMAKKVQMTFLKPLPIFQFHYMTEQEKMRLLLAYQHYLTMDSFDSLRSKEQWYLAQLAAINYEFLPENSLPILTQLKEQIIHAREELDEIQLYLDGEY